MAAQHAATLGVGAACKGVAVALDVAVTILVQVLSVALEKDDCQRALAQSPNI